MSRFYLLLLACTLAACGTRGPLELPVGPAPEPVLGGSAPPIRGDLNKPADKSTTNTKARTTQ